MSNKQKNKIIAIIGPTAGGKTGLSVDLAYKYKGEIISADSRQVYKGMDVGTGKDLADYTIQAKDKNGKAKKIKIPYHLIDVVSPKTNFSLAKYQKKGERALKDILKRNKLPLIAGGTGLYAQALVEGYNLSKIKPDPELRKNLEKLTPRQLYKKLVQLDKAGAQALNNSDRNNPRRLIRQIERARLGKQPKEKNSTNKEEREFLVICLAPEKQELEKRIKKRLKERLEEEGMIKEVRNLHYEKGVSWRRLESFGLEYKYISFYLRDKISYPQMKNDLYTAICQFANRQLTWFRRWERQGRTIYWVKSKAEANKLAGNFLK